MPMNIYIYIYTYIHTYIYMYIYICIYSYICIKRNTMNYAYMRSVKTLIFLS